MAELKAVSPEGTLGNFEAAILELTTEPLPNYADLVRRTDTSELSGMMDALVCQTLTEELKGKTREKMLVSLLIVMSAKQKHSNQLLQQTLAEVETQKTKNNALKKNNDIKEVLVEASFVSAKANETVDSLRETRVPR